jgi:endonuclease/exonuclease/phosphatase (EEP) superfamily protein YafD
MKLISLNTWGGRAGKEQLLDFFNRHKDVDVFCLQEIWNGGEEMIGIPAGGVPMIGIVPSMFNEIGGVLKNHTPYFRPHFRDFYGLTMFVRNSLEVNEEGEIFVYKERGYVSKEDIGDHARNLQYATIAADKGMRTVMNFHGAWIPGSNKKDNDDRLLQSNNIARFVKNLSSPYVLVGDFNLLPTTISLKKLEDTGARNLIKEFGITSTRSSHYKKPERFADYAFVSDGIKVNDFRVLPDEVSDHLAMYLDFE